MLMLADVAFQDFEIPERINFGGEQSLTVHTQAGGTRIVDAMGRADSDIAWQGRFRGADGLDRARYLDYLRVSGQQLALSWDEFTYTVVIKTFSASYEYGGLEVPYSIACLVVADLTTPQSFLPVSFEESFLDDLSSALGLGDTLSSFVGEASALSSAAQTAVGSVVSQVSVLQSSFTAWQSIQTRSNLLNVAEGLSGAIGLTNAASSTVNGIVAGVSSVGGVSAGFPALSASSMPSVTAAMQVSGTLQQMTGTLGRMGSNVAQMLAGGI